MTETVFCRRSGDIAVMITLVDSPDDGGYYLEKAVLPDDQPMRTYHSKIYPSKSSARADLKSNIINWEETD